MRKNEWCIYQYMFDDISTSSSYGHSYSYSYGSNATSNFKAIWPPLVWAISENHIEAVELLLDNGADPNINYTGDPFGRDDNIDYPLCMAIYCHSREIFDLLVERGADIDLLYKPNSGGTTIADVMYKYDWIDITRWLRDKYGYDILFDSNGVYRWIDIVTTGLLDYAIDSGFDINDKVVGWNGKEMSLIEAMHNNIIDTNTIIARLMERGLDPSEEDMLLLDKNE